MKKLLFLSGKGGTGKTTVASAIIKMSKAKAFADCDVYAPNLHLMFSKLSLQKEEPYYGLNKAFINNSLCNNCGECLNVCRFNAIKKSKGRVVIDSSLCEGCSYCTYVCPKHAISLKEEEQGLVKLLRSKGKIMSTANLYPGSGTTGLLVSSVKEALFTNISKDTKLAVIDGSPGIGCPVIASIKGVDMVLLVVEGSISGLSDMKRIIDTANIFGPKIAVCINKAGINKSLDKEIIDYCFSRKISFLGSIPYDKRVNQLTNNSLSIADEKDSVLYNEIFSIYQKIIIEINKTEEKSI